MRVPLTIVVFLCCFSSCKTQELLNENVETIKRYITSESYPNIDGILVSQNDKLLIEAYFNGFEKSDLHQTRSSFKSITSLLAGIAIDKGLFSVNDKIVNYITEWKNDPRGNILVKDLLEMKSGLKCEGFYDVGPDCESEMYETENWLEYILNIPLRYKPGFKWEYTSMEPDLVGIIIARTSKMTLMEFADRYLFQPIGIEHCEWEITPDGRGYAAGSSSMKPMDMLKISQLILNNGKWEGQQVVSKDWVEKSTHCNIDTEMSFLYWSGMKNVETSTAKYGYFWYREVLQFEDIKTEVLFASGNGGQYMMILKDYNAAIAFTGSNYGNWKGKLPFEILLKYIIPVLEKNTAG